MSLDFYIITCYFFAVIEIICAIKVATVYKEKRNFVSILMICWFAVGVGVGIFAVMTVLNRPLYEGTFYLVLITFIMILIMILLYMLDLRKPLLIPVAILIVTVIIFLISPEIYEVTHRILLYSLGFIPIVGFFYLTFKNKDVKSLILFAII